MESTEQSVPLKPLRTKCYVLFKDLIRTTQKTLSVSVIKTS